ncbi:MAG: acyloxyacyl hydrolase [Fimbriimonadaceae bacterium]|nr:acyloxyacyl hydrolase [Fimbriimonadaceae bacterium]
MHSKLCAAILGLLLAASSQAQEDRPLRQVPRSPYTYISVFGGHSITILGSEDPRAGFGLSMGYGRHEPRFAIRDVDTQLVYEGYYEHSSSNGVSGHGPNHTEAFGMLAFARYRWPKNKGVGFYFSVGWGLQYATRRTVDLDSKFNSTPMVGFGVAWDTGKGEGSIGLRLLHISNAGTVGDNQGQNQLFLVYSWRF